MSQRIVIGMDLGTGSVKAVAAELRKGVVASAVCPITTRHPHPDWAVQSPAEYWAATIKALAGLTDRIDRNAVEALCIGGAMHNVIPLGPGDQPLCDAMTWADRRAADLADEMLQAVDRATLYRSTGCPLSALYHPPRLRWLRKHVPTGRRFVSLKDFVLHELTGCWVADVSLASATGLLDVHDRQWHVPSLGLAGVSADELPDLNQPGEVVGSIDSGAASLCHLPEGLPVITAASDGALANLGAGAVEDELVITVGTSAAVRMINSAPHFDEQLRTWCYVFDESRWLNGGAMNSGGMALQHVAERFYGAMPIERALQRMETEASQIAPGADGLIVLPFINGERGLIWSSRAEFELIGWNETRHGPAHVVRAAMEAVALCLAELAEAMPRPAHEAARLTGGVTRSMLWRQIIADVLGRSLRPVDAADASALGAAVMGLVSIGADKGSLQWLGCANEQVEPDSAARERYQSLRHRFVRACDRAGYLVC